MKPTIKDLLRENDGTLPPYAWPGGYQIMYTDKENSALCPDCANKQLAEDKELAQAGEQSLNPPITGWFYMETCGEYETCDECGETFGEEEDEGEPD